MKYIVIAILWVVTPLVAISQDNVALKAGHKLKFFSNALHESREVWVYLPPNYDDKHFQPVSYPVLYVLDGDLHFHSITGMIQALGSGVNGTFSIPEMIVVSIPNTDRTRDLTPTHSLKGFDGKEQSYLQSSGGGTNFLAFVKNELIPKIDSAYRTFPYRTLIGHSFGGITALNALYTMPEVFNSYIVIDPSMWWDDQLMLTKAREYFKTANLKGKALFLAQANTLAPGETTNGHYGAIKEFATVLEKQNTSGLRTGFKYYPDDHHGAVAFTAGHDGLLMIFKEYSAPVSSIKSPEELEAQYKKFSTQNSITMPPPERVVHQFAGIEMFRNNQKLAEEYFQLNIRLYPKSSAAYANLGDLKLAQGNKNKALECYEKSLALYPDNQSTKNQVEALRKEVKK